MRKNAVSMIQALGLACLLAGGLLLPSGAAAAIPGTMNYQGRVRASGGGPVADGSYPMTFKIYNVDTGGTELWDETHAGVAVTAGLFNVVLGSLAPIALPFDQPYWLGVEFNGDGEMAPRTQLTTAPYAFTAGKLAVPANLVATSAQAVIKVENSDTGDGLQGIGNVGVRGVSNMIGGMGVRADQGAGANALYVQGNAFFDPGVGFASVTFNSHVHFGGATSGLPGVAVPLSLSANLGTGPILTVANTNTTDLGRGISVSAQGGYALYVDSGSPIRPAAYVRNTNGQDGMHAVAPGGRAVVAQGNSFGLSATASSAGGTAVFGQSPGTGVYAEGGNFGLYGYASGGTAVYAQSAGAGNTALQAINNTGRGAVVQGNLLGLSATASGGPAIYAHGSAVALDAEGALNLRARASMTLPPVGQGRIYFDNAANRFRVSEDGSSWQDLLFGGVTAPLSLTSSAGPVIAAYNNGSSADQKALVGLTTNHSGSSGVYGQASAVSAYAIHGLNTGTGVGVLAQSGGRAVVAEGGTFGISATASSASGRAVYGRSSSTNPTAEFINDNGAASPLKVNALHFPSGSGLSGQVLTTDGSSLMSWANVPAPTAPLSLTATTASSTLHLVNTLSGYGLNVKTSNTVAQRGAIYAEAGNGSLQAFAVHGRAVAGGGASSGVLGMMGNPVTPTSAVYPNGAGVFGFGGGFAFGGAFQGYLGVRGDTTYGDGDGVFGYNANASAAGNAIRGQTVGGSNSGAGVVGDNMGFPNSGFGVLGTNVSAAGSAVAARHTASSGAAVALSATSASTAGSAIFGRVSSTAATAQLINDNAAGYPLKLNAWSITGSAGVAGQVLTTDGSSLAYWAAVPGPSAPFVISALSNNPQSVIRGVNTSSSGSGVRGETSSGSLSYGVVGEELSIHVDAAGVLGLAGGAGTPSGIGTAGIGVVAAHGSGGQALYARSLLGGGRAAIAEGSALGLSASASATNGIGVWGGASTISGFNTGVHGSSASGGGIGVFGQNTGATGTGIGVAGNSSSSTGIGVLGETASYTTSNYGVQGTGGHGVMGAGKATGTVYGVRGDAQGGGTSAAGVVGQYMSAAVPTGQPAGVGVIGVNDTANGWGMQAYAMGTGGRGLVAQGGFVGVSASASSGTGSAYYGWANSTGYAMTIYNAGGTGILGTSAVGGWSGVWGQNEATTGNAIGVRGGTASSTGKGVVGYSTTMPTLPTVSIGVAGYSDQATGIGVWAKSIGTSGMALVAEGAATALSATSTGTTNNVIFASGTTGESAVRGDNTGTGSGVFGRSTNAGGEGVSALNTAATVAGGGAALNVQGIIRVAQSSNSYTPVANIAATVNASHARVGFSSGGAFTTITLSNNVVTANSTVVATFNTANQPAGYSVKVAAGVATLQLNASLTVSNGEAVNFLVINN